MAKKRTVFVDVVVDDKGTTKKLAIDSKRLSDGLQKGQKNTKDFDRNLRGVIQTSQAGGRNFSALAQGITNGIVPAYAAFAAQVFAIGAAFRFLQSAGDLATLQKGQQAYASATGIGLKTLTGRIQEATNNQIAFTEAAQAAAIGTAAGLSGDQLERLGGAAKDVSLLLGRDVTDSFNRLVRGVTKAEPELLDELGIVLRLKDATEEYARSLGKNASELTTFERSQAVANNVLTQAEEKYGRIIDIVDPSVNQFNKFGKAFDDIVNSIRKGLNTLLGPIAGFLAENPFATLLVSAPLLNGIIKSMIPSFNGLGNAASDMFGGLADSLKETERAAKIELTSLKFLSGDAEAATEFVKQTNAELVDLADVSETGFRGLKTLQQGGELAGKTIATNLKQAKLGLGPFADLPDTVRDEYVRMFEDLGTAAKLSGGKVASEMNIATSRARLAFVKLRQSAVTQFQKIAAAAQRAAVKIARIFTRLISGIGIVTLLGEGIIAGLNKLGINFDVLDRSQQKYLSVLESLNDENAQFKELQVELNSEFKEFGQISKTVAENLGNFMKNIDFNEESRQIKKLVDSLGEESLTASFSGTFGELDSLAEAQLLRLTTIRDTLVELVPSNTLNKGSKAAGAFLIELDKVIDLLTFAKEGEGPNQFGEFLETLDLDLSAFTRANAEFVNLMNTVQELKKDLPDVEDKARDAFKDLVPDNTYGPLIKDLDLIDQKYKIIAKDNEGAAQNLIAIDEVRKNRLQDLLRLFKVEQKRIIDSKNAAVKRDIFEIRNSKLLAKFQKERLKSFKEEQSLLDTMTDIQGQINTIYQSAAILNKGVLEQEDQDTITNLLLRKQLLTDQVDRIRESREEMQRLNQAALDGVEQALQKNIFDVLTGKESELGDFLLKIADQTYTAAANELSKILTENIFDLFPGSKDTQEEQLKNLYNDIFVKGGGTLGAAIQAELEGYKAAALGLSTRYDGMNEEEKTQAILGQGTITARNPKAPKTEEETTSSTPGKGGRSIFDIFDSMLLEQQKTNQKLEEMNRILRGQPVGTSSTLPPPVQSKVNRQETENAETNTASAASIKAGGESIERSATLIAANIGRGGQMSGRSIAGGVLSDIGSAFVSSLAGNFARYGGVMRDYSAGGIARGRQAGYPAMLHGTEAVVPLPNGKSIPVDISGSGAGVNNVSVSVNMEGATNVQGGEEGGQNLGKAIAGVVQQELQRQKRPGGILSPLGAA